MQYYQQLGVNDCGPACLAMVASHYRSYALDIAANNNLIALSVEIKALTDGKNAGLTGKAKARPEKMGIE